MVRPIPLKMLIHSVEYEEYDGQGRNGDRFKPPVELKNVLVQPISGVSQQGVSEEKTFNSLLFFDVVHSLPSVNFKPKSRVTFNSETMIVGRVNPIYAFTLHHYEVELI